MEKRVEDFVFGANSVLETLKSDKDIDKIFIQKTAKSDQIRDIIRLASDRKIPVLQVPVEKLNRITMKNHQGVICFVSTVSYMSLDGLMDDCFEAGKVPLVMILDRITDVRNFGAISRTAECAGVDAIVIPAKGAAQIGSDAMKTSSGALNYLNVCRSENLKETIQYLKDYGFQIVGCTEKTEDSVYDADYTSPTAIILGSEEDGISSEYLKMCDSRAKIPLKGKVGSLNVSVSAAVIVYEAVRQRSLVK